ncbi:MAG: AtpZ/AtpI family protein [Sulfuricurvum sp.]|uniref:Arginine biosynthesis protein ArgJ n=1 Tax=Sulfuricurvum kujiense TaxID=148813 RepID=A0A2D3WIX4_9BACT|nr:MULTISPECIES: AtpZ/AtpI family protein [Sulfuricurvum]MDP2851359.1 AtpZ/AtpI family protein [Sulfuricurvum sp.]OHD92657.1 MAG: arginine biosynthesis protein ArgJ [Sulfuricurvum sp. RIFOXYD12_FULL_44_77]OHD93771.1 MAG: arginine biosynthesis protein ArgJ [Sulfuricurvum sp. RIFOXYD2_FULL_44_160]DAB38216.1 MAG TPA: arginine biosynthesis protein ArgJ [Sulfuricurvum kujiense]
MSAEEEKPRLKPIIEGAETLSLGISMVVAILIGVAIGLGLKKLTGITWLLWIGVAIGILAAILNVYKAYSKQYKEFEKLAKDPRYNMGKSQKDDDDEDED